MAAVAAVQPEAAEPVQPVAAREAAVRPAEAVQPAAAVAVAAARPVAAVRP